MILFGGGMMRDHSRKRDHFLLIWSRLEEQEAPTTTFIVGGIEAGTKVRNLLSIWQARY